MNCATITLSKHDTMPCSKVRASLQRSAVTLALARVPILETIFLGAPRPVSQRASMSAAEIDCYFSCKAAFVGALIDCDVRQIEEHFDDLMASKRSMATMKAHFQRIAASDCFDTHANWAPITDTAACKPNVIAALSRMEASIINQIRVILAFVRSLPGPDATGSVATQARATCLIAHDALFAVKVDDGQNAALTALIMCAIDWVLNDTLASLTGVPT